MESENWNINIIIIIASAVLGYILPYVIKFVKSIVNLIFRKELLKGTWYAYHFTLSDNKVFIRYEKWTIKRDWLNRLIIKTEDPKNHDLKYEGVILVDKNYLLILLKGVKHEEEIQMRFFNIIPTGQDMTLGLAMGIDFNGKPQCLVRIMSRKKLTNKKASEILRSKTIINDQVIMGISE